MESAEIEPPVDEPETAREETVEGSPAERTRDASRHADREAREQEAAEE